MSRMNLATKSTSRNFHTTRTQVISTMQEENLLGYLLGALDGDEHEKVRRELEDNPALREKLDMLELCLAPLEQDRWQHEPPAGLAAATCQFIADSTNQTNQTNQTALEIQPRRSANSRFSQVFSEWNPQKHGWDMIDAAVAAGIFFAAALLFFPAIAGSRDQARRLACENNLRSSSVALSMFGERNNHAWGSANLTNVSNAAEKLALANATNQRLWLSTSSFPYIPATGKAGVAGFYAPQLVQGGFQTDHSVFLCPSSNLGANGRHHFFVPTIEQIESADGESLANLQRVMGGSYMYTLGHISSRRHLATRNLGRRFFPIMSDGFFSQNDGGTVLMHGGKGMNIAFEDGHVKFVVNIALHHDFFTSDRGLVEAGRNANDAVLGHSWNRPLPDTADLWSDLGINAPENSM